MTIGFDDAVTDAAVLDALVTAEAALTRAWTEVGAAPADASAAVSLALGWRAAGDPCHGHDVDLGALARAGVAGGNPVIPLVGHLKQRVPAEHRAWVHRGATSQDILDSALMLVSRIATVRIGLALAEVENHITALAAAHRDTVAAARTLGQHAVPTTVGLRAAAWAAGVRRARTRLIDVSAHLPAQLGGAAGTLASFVEIATRSLGDLAGHDAARRLPAVFAAELGLAAPDAPWHTTRWPITELGDALVQAVDAVSVIATDVATLSRTEIGEIAEGAAGGSSAMPQKQNPAASVVVRSAGLRAPQLAATLHLASALAVDERPDGAWHAEWPTLRELLRLALGATGTAARLVAGLQVDADAVARNLAATHGLIVSERLSAVLNPILGADGVATVVARASAGEDLRTVLGEYAGLAGIHLDDLLDPARYTGLAADIVDAATAHPDGPTRLDAPDNPDTPEET